MLKRFNLYLTISCMIFCGIFYYVAYAVTYNGTATVSIVAEITITPVTEKSLGFIAVLQDAGSDAVFTVDTAGSVTTSTPANGSHITGGAAGEFTITGTPSVRDMEIYLDTLATNGQLPAGSTSVNVALSVPKCKYSSGSESDCSSASRLTIPAASVETSATLNTGITVTIPSATTINAGSITGLTYTLNVLYV